jgi:hypothetical protein
MTAAAAMMTDATGKNTDTPYVMHVRGYSHEAQISSFSL